VNLTNHTVVLQDNRKNGKRLVIRPSGVEFRIKTREETITELNGIRVIRRYCTNLHQLPPPKPKTIYIVSTWAMVHARRPDVVSPGKKVFGKNGVVACYDLQCIVCEDDNE
jgi:hypothetical protein